MFKKIAIVSATAALFGIGQGAWAGSTSASAFTVTASVNQTCAITTGPGNQTPTYDPVAGTAVDFTPTILFKCTKNSASVYVSPNLSTNASGTQRRLSDGGGTPTYLNYNLFQPSSSTTPTTCAYSTIYDPSQGSHAGDYALAAANFTNSGTSVTVNLCGRIAAGQEASVGSTYTDSVVVTVWY
jgi:hypothetical protein